MYVGRAKRGRTGLAGAHGLSRLRGLRGRALGQDDGINWGNILQTGIQTAGAVSAIAFKPPTYSSVINPYTGAQTVTSYANTPPSSSLLGVGPGSSFTELLTSPLVLVGGLLLVAVFALKK